MLQLTMNMLAIKYTSGQISFPNTRLSNSSTPLDKFITLAVPHALLDSYSVPHSTAKLV